MPSSEAELTSPATCRSVAGVKCPDLPPTASTGAASGPRHQFADLLAFAEHRPVEPGRAFESVGPRVGAGELVDVPVAERAGGRAQGGQVVLGEERALPPGEQHLRDTGGGE